DQQVVRAARDEDADVDAAHDRREQRRLHVHARHEAGTDDPDAAASPGNDLAEGDSAFLDLVGRAAAHDQDAPAAINSDVIRAGGRDHLAGRPVPVFTEDQSATGRCRPRHVHLGIAPAAEARTVPEILDADILATDPRLGVVDHHDLAVVAVVDAHRAVEPQQLVLAVEAGDVDAAGPQPGEVAAWQEDAADIVIELIDVDRKSTRLNSSHVKISYA